MTLLQDLISEAHDQARPLDLDFIDELGMDVATASVDAEDRDPESAETDNLYELAGLMTRWYDQAEALTNILDEVRDLARQLQKGGLDR